MSDEHHYRFHITMSCGGCSGAVQRVLRKQTGVKPFDDIDHNKPLVDVFTDDSLSLADVKQIIVKTGKTVKAAVEVRDGKQFNEQNQEVEITKEGEEKLVKPQ